MRAAVGTLVFWLGATFVGGCTEKKTHGSTQTLPPSVGSTSSAAVAPAASASAVSAVPSANVASRRAPVVPVGTPLGPIEVLRSDRAGLAFVLAEDARHATIVNEKTGEWRFVSPRREGETLWLETPGAKLSLGGAGAKRRLSVSFGEAAARTFDTAIVKLPSHPPPSAVTTVDGEGLSSAALSSLPTVMLGKTPMVWVDGFLPASPSLPPPPKLALGARTIEPLALPRGHEGRCTVVGFVPTAEGALGEALAAAQKHELETLCRARTEATLVEAGYTFVRFKGVNLLDEGHEPDPTDVVGLDFVLRVTDAWGSSVSETGYLVGLAKGEVASLASLLKPAGAAFLEKKALEPYSIAPPQLAAFSPKERAALLDLTHATLALGPSTVDIVIPTEPLGLFLGPHRVRLGPRSDLFPAFVNGPLTQRLVAAVWVDY